jgi:hypothetical protein
VGLGSNHGSGLDRSITNPGVLEKSLQYGSMGQSDVLNLGQVEEAMDEYIKILKAELADPEVG